MNEQYTKWKRTTSSSSWVLDFQYQQTFHQNSISSQTFCSVSGVTCVTAALILAFSSSTFLDSGGWQTWSYTKLERRNPSASSLVTTEAREWHHHDQSICVGSSDQHITSLPTNNGEVYHLAWKSVVKWGLHHWFVAVKNSWAYQDKQIQ
jgi:hypothetical protein